MSPTNHPPTGQPLPTYAGTDRVLRLKLIRSRERLASAATEHLAYDLPGADLLWQQLHEVEELLRIRFPDTWRQHYAQWVTADAAALHSGGDPHPASCPICARQATVDSSTPRAS